ncbi:LysR family transcriptional regulator [Acidovorax sp. Root275]|uniref:LysR family transcriptional regulator n=1 Tax=Acidovorax sp. Root275 TaxID=1736508 RepID=UPI00070E779A|nr:LysR family transcriptional regulator [Acidovorax sp. Root275]KRD46461.1 LysR family transcriptional regulator [Acidovorax sp. Root275]
MDIRQLRYFLAVADAGHMTRAAEQLGMAQPPLSQQIKLLENTVGMALFKRHAKGVTLTEAGRALQADATRLVHDFDALQSRMQLLAEGKTGRLAIAFTSSAAAHEFTPFALRECRARHPGLVLEIGENNAAEITEAVADGRLHCGLLRVPVARPAGLAFDTLQHEPAMVALPIDHPLAQRQRRGKPLPIQIADLEAEPMILVRRPGAPGLYANLLTLCSEQGVRPRVVAEVARMLTNLNLVAAGTGISVVPSSMLGVHRHAIAYRSLVDGGRLDVPLTLVYRADDNMGPTATFTALLRTLAGEQHPAAATEPPKKKAAR